MELVGSWKPSWRRWLKVKSLRRRRREKEPLELIDLLKFLLNLQWQNWCDPCLSVGGRREKGELSINIWRLAYLPTWVRNETLRWHKVRSWSWDTSLKPGSHGLQPQSKGRQGKSGPSERGKVKAATYLHRSLFFFFFFGLHKRNRNFRSSLVDLGQKVLDPSGPMALQTGEINTIGAKQVVGMEGPEQKQVQLFFGETLVKLPTQMSGSCQEKGSCRRGLTV